MSSTVTSSPLAPAQGSQLDESEHLPLGRRSAQASARDPVPKPGTLDKLIVAIWEGLRDGTSRCPVCGDRLQPEFGAHARPVGGRCSGCGSTLH